MELISEFDFEIKHIKGKDNRLEDTLSWSVNTINLATKSVKESNFKNIIVGKFTGRMCLSLMERTTTTMACFQARTTSTMA
jgi:hypothetical protein